MDVRVMLLRHGEPNFSVKGKHEFEGMLPETDIVAMENFMPRLPLSAIENFNLISAGIISEENVLGQRNAFPNDFYVSLADSLKGSGVIVFCPDFRSFSEDGARETKHLDKASEELEKSSIDSFLTGHWSDAVFQYEWSNIFHVQFQKQRERHVAKRIHELPHLIKRLLEGEKLMPEGWGNIPQEICDKLEAKVRNGDPVRVLLTWGQAHDSLIRNIGTEFGERVRLAPGGMDTAPFGPSFSNYIKVREKKKIGDEDALKALLELAVFQDFFEEKINIAFLQEFKESDEYGYISKMSPGEAQETCLAFLMRKLDEIGFWQGPDIRAMEDELGEITEKMDIRAEKLHAFLGAEESFSKDPEVAEMVNGRLAEQDAGTMKKFIFDTMTRDLLVNIVLKKIRSALSGAVDFPFYPGDHDKESRAGTSFIEAATAYYHLDSGK